MACTEWPGNDKASTGPWPKLLWQENASVLIRPTGGNGRKRSLLTDGNGIPLSLVAGGASRHDAKLPAPTLDSLVVEDPISDRTRHNPGASLRPGGR